MQHVRLTRSPEVPRLCLSGTVGRLLLLAVNFTEQDWSASRGLIHYLGQLKGPTKNIYPASHTSSGSPVVSYSDEALKCT